MNKKQNPPFKGQITDFMNVHIFLNNYDFSVALSSASYNTSPSTVIPSS